MAAVQEPGLNAADLRRRVAGSVATLQRSNGSSSAPEDKVRQALQLRHEVLADTILERTVDEMGVDTMKAQNERLKLEIEQQQLQEARRPAPGGQDDEMRGFMLKQLESMQAALADANRAITAQQTAQLQDRINALEAELQRGAAPVQSTDKLTAIKEELNSVLAIAELISPKVVEAPPPLAADQDPALRAWNRRMDSDDERWRVSRQQQHEERLREIELKYAVDAQEQARRDKQAQLQGRFFESTVPKVVDILEKFLGNRLSGVAAATPGGAPAMAATIDEPLAPARPMTIPEGAQVALCQVCGTRMIFRNTWTEVICNSCGEVYNLHDDTAQEAAVVEQEQGASVV